LYGYGKRKTRRFRQRSSDRQDISAAHSKGGAGEPDTLGAGWLRQKTWSVIYFFAIPADVSWDILL
jgi:hypothetical protein